MRKTVVFGVIFALTVVYMVWEVFILHEADVSGENQKRIDGLVRDIGDLKRQGKEFEQEMQGDIRILRRDFTELREAVARIDKRSEDQIVRLKNAIKLAESDEKKILQMQNGLAKLSGDTRRSVTKFENAIQDLSDRIDKISTEKARADYNVVYESNKQTDKKSENYERLVELDSKYKQLVGAFEKIKEENERAVTELANKFVTLSDKFDETVVSLANGGNAEPRLSESFDVAKARIILEREEARQASITDLHKHCAPKAMEGDQYKMPTIHDKFLVPTRAGYDLIFLGMHFKTYNFVHDKFWVYFSLLDFIIPCSDVADDPGKHTVIIECSVPQVISEFLVQRSLVSLQVTLFREGESPFEYKEFRDSILCGKEYNPNVGQPANLILQNKSSHAAAATMVQNANALLPQWIEYYRLNGVEHFYIYDNSRTRPEKQNTIRLLEQYKYISRGIVTYIPWAFPTPFYWNTVQITAQNDCLWRFKKFHEWIAIIDLDEYFFVPGNGDDIIDPDETILSVLRSYDGENAKKPLSGLRMYSFFYSNQDVDQQMIDDTTSLQIEKWTLRTKDPMFDGRYKYFVKPENSYYMALHSMFLGARDIVIEPEEVRMIHYRILSYRDVADGKEGPTVIDAEPKIRFAKKIRAALGQYS
eukprot:TRINITY_DN7920_c0_g1_i2.p1 TRINITY_DN7920_c0_g1~~TRINITY_DN7920_c0_g1_i2.p1  ORF type:complete len:647 (+),score=101.89 TRINITY_DN7920_c0_g1_i2:1683-3623(+)